ncbi:MAG: hemolysin family protein [Oscillospiraceae bacterium]|nr:hemolysin family protein [Oscillospiraceae bacterium]
MPTGDPDPILWQIALQVLLIAVNAIFACAEMAVVTMNDARLERLAAAGNKRAAKLLRVLAIPSRFFATIQVAITLAGFLGSAFAAENFAGRLARQIDTVGLGVSYSTIHTISLILITIILSYITLALGELVPKAIGRHKPEQIALALATPIWFLSKVFAPVIWLLTKTTNIVLRLMRIDPNEDARKVSEEEIKMMVDEGSEKGTIAESEKEIINNVFAFNDLSAEEVMTHRTYVDTLWVDDTDAEWESKIRETRHSYYPVAGEDGDDIIGILSSKDYYRLEPRNRENALKKAVHPAWFVPEGVKADALFRNMKSGGTHFAVVLDEYGGMSGIITIYDLLEQIVGEFDEGEEESDDIAEIIAISDSEWVVQGSAELDEVASALKVTLPVEEFDTFGGWVFGSLGEVPDDGETPILKVNGLIIECTEISDHRLESARVRKEQPILQKPQS